MKTFPNQRFRNAKNRIELTRHTNSRIQMGLRRGLPPGLENVHLYGLRCCNPEAVATRIAAPRGFMITVTELLQPVETDLETLLGDLRNLIGAGHPILQAAAEHLFSAGGKRIRPGIVLLISRALAADGELTP